MEVAPTIQRDDSLVEPRARERTVSLSLAFSPSHFIPLLFASRLATQRDDTKGEEKKPDVHVYVARSDFCGAARRGYNAPRRAAPHQVDPRPHGGFSLPLFIAVAPRSVHASRPERISRIWSAGPERKRIVHILAASRQRGPGPSGPVPIETDLAHGSRAPCAS